MSVFEVSIFNLCTFVPGTNLNGGLMAGIELLNEAHKKGSLPERSASLIIMLTDGRPTKGNFLVRRAWHNTLELALGFIF